MDAKLASEIRRELLEIRYELAWRRLKWALKNFERACRKANFNPSQPRVPSGSSEGGQWSGGGGNWGTPSANSEVGSSARVRDLVYRPDEDGAPPPILVGARGRTSITVRLGNIEVEATPGEASRLAVAEALARNEIERVREIDPRWRPTPSLTETAEGLIRAREGEANEARARFNELARGMGDNGGPPLDRLVDTSPVPSQIISAFRSMTGMPEVRLGASTRTYRGTVAYTKIDNTPFIGVNSDAPGYTVEDEVAANEMRDRLVRQHPNQMANRNLGHKPNDALYYAEATALLRARRQLGSLSSRTVEIHVDRELCGSCKKVLPSLGLELGNPTVRISDGQGNSWVMRNGVWVVQP